MVGQSKSIKDSPIARQHLGTSEMSQAGPPYPLRNGILEGASVIPRGVNCQ